MTESLYEHEYPSRELAAEHPFVTYEHERFSGTEMQTRGAAFYELMVRVGHERPN